MCLKLVMSARWNDHTTSKWCKRERREKREEKEEREEREGKGEEWRREEKRDKTRHETDGVLVLRCMARTVPFCAHGMEVHGLSKASRAEARAQVPTPKKTDSAPTCGSCLPDTSPLLLGTGVIIGHTLNSWLHGVLTLLPHRDSLA